MQNETDEVTEKDIKEVMVGILTRSRNELLAIEDPAGLEKYWYFRYDPKASVAWNTYMFFDCLEMYKRSCRDWETAKNGSCCVVERVRDKYLMPKIKLFLKEIEQ